MCREGTVFCSPSWGPILGQIFEIEMTKITMPTKVSRGLIYGWIYDDNDVAVKKNGISMCREHRNEKLQIEVDSSCAWLEMLKLKRETMPTRWRQ